MSLLSVIKIAAIYVQQLVLGAYNVALFESNQIKYKYITIVTSPLSYIYIDR